MVDVYLMVAENIKYQADNEHGVEKVLEKFDGDVLTSEYVQL